MVKKVLKPETASPMVFSQPPMAAYIYPHGNIKNINVPELTVHDSFCFTFWSYIYQGGRIAAAMLKPIQPATQNINFCFNMWLAGGLKIPFRFLYSVTPLD